MTIFVQLTHGFHVRNLLDSGFLSLLRERAPVRLVVGPSDADMLAQEYGAPDVCVSAVAIEPHRAEKWLDFVRRRILVQPGRALTVSIFSERERLSRPVRSGLLSALNRLLGRWEVLRRCWRELEARLIPGKEFDHLIAEIRPSVVITANYGTEPEAIRLIRAAHRYQVPTLSIVPSFDNLTSKGVAAAQVSRMAVWNPIMRREALEFHDMPANAVDVCGGVQFDIYRQPERWPPAEGVWQRHGLAPDRPTFVVGTVTPVYFPHNIEVIELIADAIIDGRLPRDAQILVRMHPQVIDDPTFGDDLSQYRALAEKYAFVRLNISEVRRWGRMRPPAVNDMAELATILSHAAALVVSASTLAIDAAAVGTPVVGVAFDGKSTEPPELSVARYYDFSHYRPVVASGAIDLAHSPEEMIQFLNRAIVDREANAAGRQRLVDELLWRLDGQAAARVAAVIDDLLAQRPRAGAR